MNSPRVILSLVVRELRSFDIRTIKRFFPLEYKGFLNKSIWPIDRTQTSTTTPGQSEPESNGN